VTTDCHTHVAAPEHFDASFLEAMDRAWGPWTGTLESHWAAMASVDRAVVLAFDAPASGYVVPNEYVAGYVAQHPEKLVGFASVDPNREDALERLVHAVDDLGLRGLKTGPVYQHVDPTSPRALELFRCAERLGIPMLIHQGTTFVRDAPLRVARPFLLDEVAIECPDLVICVAHLGHPWCEELMAVIRKHPHMYTDTSALHTRPVQLYFALTAAVEYRVTDKLLLGSDYPFGTIEDASEALRRVNDVVRGSGLPPVPDSVIDEIIARDALGTLGIA